MKSKNKPKKGHTGFRKGGILNRDHTHEIIYPPINHYNELLKDKLSFERDRKRLWEQVVTASVSAGDGPLRAISAADRILAEWESKFKKEAGQ